MMRMATNCREFMQPAQFSTWRRRVPQAKMTQKALNPEEPKMPGSTLLARFAAAALAALCLAPNLAAAQGGEPIKIGFGMSLTGPLAANGKQALLGMKIWEEETNAKGGLNGRQVKLVYYDD